MSAADLWLCDREQSQLVIIDVQERLATAMPADCLDNIENQIGVLLVAARQLGIPSLHSEQYPQGLGPTRVSLRQQLGTPVEKTCFACSASDTFSQRLDTARRQIILCGIETHICVLQTAVGLLEKDYQVFVVEDGVCSRRDENRRNALERIRQAGAQITNTESVLFEWLRDASHPDFKALSKLIR